MEAVPVDACRLLLLLPVLRLRALSQLVWLLRAAVAKSTR